MRLLTPLGFIALLGLVILLLIYLIKPTYQNKMLSSTYIWKESYKYRKRERPTSKLRNLLLIACQVLIVLITTFILITPVVNAKDDDKSKQDILIIDKSADMLLENGVDSRFSRAIDKTLEMALKATDENRYVSVITSGDEASLLVNKTRNYEEIKEVLAKESCSYSVGDLEGALGLANDIIKTNSLAQVYFITGTKYENIGDLIIVDVSDPNDWNSAILDVRALLNDNYYSFEVDLATYGLDKYINVYLNVHNINNTKESKVFSERVNSLDGKLITVDFKETEIFSYENLDVTIKMDDGSEDGFRYDDSCTLFGGIKPTINIQYTSSARNNFFVGALNVLKSSYKDSFNINLSFCDALAEAKTKGFDFYIFEHTMPSTMPTDGFTLLVNPDSNIRGLGLDFGPGVTGDFKIDDDLKHEVLKFVDSSRITSTFYKPIGLAEGFNSLWEIKGETVFAINDTAKVAALTLNLNRSNLALLPDFPTLIINMFNFFIPETLVKNTFEVNEDILVNTRGTELMLKADGTDYNLTIPETITINKPGKYQIVERVGGKLNTIDFYVKIAASESNPELVVVNLNGKFKINRPDNVMKDIMLYLAASLIVVLALEKFLASKENI